MPVSQPGPSGEANYVGIILKAQISDEERRLILENPWIPETTFKFPGSGARNLKFQYGWLSRWKWLLYSKFEDGAYCKYCSLFSSFGAGRGFQTLGVLVKKPFSRWKDAVEQFKNHENNEYHKRCVLKAEDWLKIDRGSIPSVQILQNTALQQQISENRKAVLPIIETVLFCGRQGIPLRAHRDHGNLDLEVCPDENEGNFRALLRFRVDSGDKDLKKHLELGPKNALYLSPKTQNEIISAANNIMLKKLVEMVNSAKCFTVLADETTDVSTQEQTSIGVRYIHKDSIREDFLQFIPVYDLTGKNLATIILNSLREFGIDTKFLRGQGYDGASAMSGKYIGAQAYVTEKHPTAIYVHCASHSLNLAISGSCSISDLRNCCGTATKLCVFFNTPKRMEVIKRAIEKMFPEAKSTRLKQLCPTRWVERHDSILQLQEMLPAVYEALEEVSQWEDLESASMASQLIYTLQSSSFIISLQVMSKVFSLSLPLARLLQNEDLDLLDAINMVNSLKKMIEKIRSNAGQEFSAIFHQSKAMAELLSSSIKTPRRTGKQTQRCNIETDTPESYFRISIFLPFLDHFLNEMNRRFLKHENILGSFECLIPTSNTQATKAQEEVFKKLLNFYQGDVEIGEAAAIGELRMWYERVKHVNITSRKAIDFYTACNKDVFPTINTLLKILVRLPVTTSTSERSFSTLRRLKTYLRSTTGQQRLNGLAMLNIHRELDITASEVLDVLAKTPRRLEFKLS